MAKIVLEEENKTADNVEIEETTTEEVVAPTEDVATEPEEETTDDVAITYQEEAIDTGFEVDDTEESPDEDEGVMLLPSDEEDATPVYSGETVQATETGEGEGKKWDSYTTESDIADDDELMILDKSAKANKRTLLSKIADYVIDKLTTAVVSKLTTTDKTIPGAINELNSNTLFSNIVYVDGGIYDYNTYTPQTAAQEIIDTKIQSNPRLVQFVTFINGSSYSMIVQKNDNKYAFYILYGYNLTGIICNRKILTWENI